MAPTKRTPFMREENLHRITELYLRGRTQSQIGAELGLSQGMISNDLKLIQQRWREQTTFNLDEAKGKELARLDALERECWAAWEQSKSERTKARQKTSGKGKDGKAAITEASMEKEQRDGNPAFLQAVLSCIDRRCKLLGLDAPTKQQNFNVDLSTLTDEQLDRLEAGEPLEQVMRRGQPTA